MASKSSSTWTGSSLVIGSSESSRMAWLTLSIIGLQFTWGLETTYCTPYLLQLGLTKSKTSIVWIAGPISGMLVAPIVGALADRSTSRWGRRRPFMIGGTVASCLFLLLLGWAKEITSFVLGAQASNGTPTVLVAVGSLFALDVAINTVQWSSRSLIVDTLPASKQQMGSAWASRMVATGHLIGYGLGAVDMGSVLGYSAQGAQFKSMVVIAALALLLTVGATSWAVTEKVLVLEDSESHVSKSTLALMSEITTTAMNMPSRMKAICRAQFWAWIGWFPFLFYGSEWIGEIALHEIHETQKTQPQDRLALIGMKGSKALVLFSIVAFVGSVTLPLLVQSPEDENLDQNITFTPRPPAGLAFLINYLRLDALPSLRKPSLGTAWLLAHLLFAASMGCAPLVSRVAAAEFLIALCGLSWSLATWAPHAFMGFEISKVSQHIGHNHPEDLEIIPLAQTTRSAAPPSTARNKWIEDNQTSPTVQRYYQGSRVQDGQGRSGIYLGILNLFITLPQFIGAFISSVIFWLFDNPETDIGRGYLSIALCLFGGAIAALAAAYATNILRKTR